MCTREILDDVSSTCLCGREVVGEYVRARKPKIAHKRSPVVEAVEEIKAGQTKKQRLVQTFEGTSNHAELLHVIVQRLLRKSGMAIWFYSTLNGTRSGEH